MIAINVKLILVEGLPSSGKSTSAKLVSEVLNERDIEYELFHEGNPNHPVDYDGVAFLDDIKLHSLMNSFKNFKEEICSISANKRSNYLVEYKKGIVKHKIKLPGELLYEFYKNDIYELPLELHLKYRFKDNNS